MATHFDWKIFFDWSIETEIYQNLSISIFTQNPNVDNYEQKGLK